MKASTKSNLEIIGLTTREILLSFVDSVAWFYAQHHTFRRSAREYLEERDIERGEFFERIAYLKRMGYIKTFVEQKEKYIELTAKGIEKAKNFFIDDLEIKHPKGWDGKWRVVIFDIAEEKRHHRDVFREKIEQLGFIQIQKSVYAYPFECTREISFVAEILDIEKEVTIMVAEIIQGEENIINLLLKNNVLTKNDLKNK